MAKQRYDLWILKNQTIRLIAVKKTWKQCREREIDLVEGEVVIMTPTSTEAYCPILRHQTEQT